MARRSRMTGKKAKWLKWAFIAGAVIVGAVKHVEIMEFVQKIPVVKDIVNKLNGTEEA